jgi:hypothetical protein
MTPKKGFPIQSQNFLISTWVDQLSPFLEQNPFYKQWLGTLTTSNPLQAQVQGGPNSLRATVFQVLICPADALPNPPIVQILAPGLSATYPDGIFSSLTSYGPNTGTRGWASYYTPPEDR